MRIAPLWLLPVATTSWDLPIFQLSNNNNNKKNSKPVVSDSGDDPFMYGPFTLIPPPNKGSSDDPLPWIHQSTEDQLLTILRSLESFLLYKPPVGATAALMLIRLLFFGKGKRFLSSLTALQNAEEQVLDRAGPTKRRKRRRGRSLDLDTSDKLYDAFGGIESVRAQLYALALSGFLDDELPANWSSSSLSKNERDAMERTALSVAAAIEAVTISCPPRGSREFFVEKLAEPLSFLYPYLQDDYKDSQQQQRSYSSSSSGNEQKIDQWIQQAAKVAELRALDALLRTLRDRQLISTARLRRAVDRWSRMVKRAEGGIFGFSTSSLRRMVLGRSLVDDRNDLALAVAAYQQETKLLGDVQQILLQRPTELSQDTLLALDGNQETPKTSSRAKEALNILSNVKKNGNNRWLEDAREWSLRARQVICNAISVTSTTLVSPSTTTTNTTLASRFITVDSRKQQLGPSTSEMAEIKRWCKYESLSDVEGWNSLITRVDRFAKYRRTGESLTLWNSLGTVKSLVRNVDVLGIPSSVAAVGVSLLVHNTVRPYWGNIVHAGLIWKNAVWGIIEFRFYNPLRDIVLDLLNRRPKLVDPFAVLNEQTSLNNMLRDLGIGDGTTAGRDSAIAAASRLYEQELRKGPIRSIFGGNIVRLLLIQVQQLKADLLTAMDSIDVLVDANRLNLQLLAGIPAVLFVTFGVRLFFQWMYSFRSFEIRSIREVHSEMTDYLDRSERLLLLSNRQSDVGGPSPQDSKLFSSAAYFLQPPDLGELVVLMHSYLVMIDYASPPFSSKACDSIQDTVQDLFTQGELSVARQLEIVRLIKSKHIDLVK